MKQTMCSLLLIVELGKHRQIDSRTLFTQAVVKITCIKMLAY